MTPTSSDPNLEPDRRWEQDWAAAWPSLIVISTIAAAIAFLFGVESQIRGPLVLWFCLVCPGMAWARLLRLGEPLVEGVIAVALSVALSGLTAGAFLYAGQFTPGLILAVLMAIALLGVALGSPSLHDYIAARLRRDRD